MKVCTKCKIVKPKSEFHKQKCKADGLRYNCKECRADKAAIFFKDNKDKILAKNKIYYKANRNEIQKKNKEYYDNKYCTDINFKLAHVLRTRLNNAIKVNQKTGSAIKDLGCSIEELKIHLESQFQEGMSWDNYGLHGWHIDHIKPLSKFDLTDRKELLKVCHFSNLQPLWAKDNLIKGNR